MSESTATITNKLHEELISILKASSNQLGSISHPDFGKPDLLIRRVNTAIAHLQGKPTPRSNELFPSFNTRDTLANGEIDEDK